MGDTGVSISSDVSGGCTSKKLKQKCNILAKMEYFCYFVFLYT